MKYKRSTSPFLCKENRIRTIHASLAIENNTLTLEQATAVLNGKYALGQQNEIQEIRNAFSAYEHLEAWKFKQIFLEQFRLAVSKYF